MTIPMPRIRPSEYRAVLQLLSAPADSVEDLATDVILAIDALRANRTDWVSVVEMSPGFVMLFGPYITKGAAERDIGRSVFATREGMRAMVLPLTTSIEEGLENDSQ
jgi:hypothetical protein